MNVPALIDALYDEIRRLDDIETNEFVDKQFADALHLRRAGIKYAIGKIKEFARLAEEEEAA